VVGWAVVVVVAAVVDVVVAMAVGTVGGGPPRYGGKVDEVVVAGTVEIVVAGNVVATGTVVAGWLVAAGNAVEVVGTVVVVACRSGEELRFLRWTRRFGLGVVVLAVLAVLAPLDGLAKLGRVVVVRAEVCRTGGGFVVVVRAELRRSELLRSPTIVVVVVFARLVVGAPVAGVPARYPRSVDPCHRCRVFALAGIWPFAGVCGRVALFDRARPCDPASPFGRAGLCDLAGL
jgi:hypothetical protein